MNRATTRAEAEAWTRREVRIGRLTGQSRGIIRVARAAAPGRGSRVATVGAVAGDVAAALARRPGLYTTMVEPNASVATVLQQSVRGLPLAQVVVADPAAIFSARAMRHEPGDGREADSGDLVRPSPFDLIVLSGILHGRSAREAAALLALAHAASRGRWILAERLSGGSAFLRRWLFADTDPSAAVTAAGWKQFLRLAPRGSRAMRRRWGVVQLVGPEVR